MRISKVESEFSTFIFATQKTQKLNPAYKHQTPDLFFLRGKESPNFLIKFYLIAV